MVVPPGKNVVQMRAANFSLELDSALGKSDAFIGALYPPQRSGSK